MSTIKINLQKIFSEKFPEQNNQENNNITNHMNIINGFNLISYFNTITQYDASILNKSGNLCSLFSLITAYKFMQDIHSSKNTHEENIQLADLNFENLNLKKEMSFDELLKYSNLKKNVSVMLNEILDYSLLFPNEPTFCTIILKNSKFFVVTKDKNGYSIRDCHEIVQYNFIDLQDLIMHLENIYHFGKEIDIDGYTIAEFNVIEYLVIKNKFKLNENLILIKN